MVTRWPTVSFAPQRTTPMTFLHCPSSFRRHVASLAMALPLAVGCREPVEPGARPPVVARSDQYLAEVIVAPGPASDRWLVRVTITGGVATTRVGGFRARLVVPPPLVVQEDPANQGAAQGAMTRVVRSERGDVLAVGASAEGMPMGDLFVAIVQGPASALGALRLELDELVDVRGADQRSRAVVAPRVNDQRIRR
jgi:hypothetical protein